MRSLIAAALLIALIPGKNGAAEKERDLIIPPPGHAYTGAYIDFGDHEDEVTIERIEKFEEMVGKKQAIVASSSFWGERSFPKRNVEIIQAHGSVPFIYWSPWDRPYTIQAPNTFSLTSILEGQHDGYIDDWGRQARENGRPIFVAWGLEMNGDWFPWSGVFYGKAQLGPAMYKKAYRYVVERVRAQGASNVIWVFHANNSCSPDEAWNRMGEYYPGDDVVDWLGLSAYGQQYPLQGWVECELVFTPAYKEICRLSIDKPVIMAEWGIGEFPSCGSKAKWITEAFHRFETEYPRLKAAIFWHERWQNGGLGLYSNLRVHSSNTSLEAYRKAVASPFWLGGRE
jgi:beta-mannanase